MKKLINFFKNIYWFFRIKINEYSNGRKMKKFFEKELENNELLFDPNYIYWLQNKIFNIKQN